MPDADSILRHIRHAEEWLRWARGDCRRGDLRSALLRLLLAEAEIRHARETAPAPARPSGGPGTSRARLAALGAAAAVTIAAAGYAVSSMPFAHPAGAPAVARVQEPLGVVQLETGRFLTLVPSPPSGGVESSDAWGSGAGSGWLTDNPAARTRVLAPAVLGGPADMTPADPERQSSSF